MYYSAVYSNKTFFSDIFFKPSDSTRQNGNFKKIYRLQLRLYTYFLPFQYSTETLSYLINLMYRAAKLPMLCTTDDGHEPTET